MGDGILANQARVAVVTGAGTGIGRASAIALIQDGYRVALAGRRMEPLQETAELAGSPQSAIAVPTDVADASSVDNLFSKTVEAFGRIDVLFNNAGVGAPAAEVDELSLEQWQNVVDINLTGVFLCCRAAMKVMKTKSPPGGRIINNGSIAATTPRPLSAPYSATKHAVTGLTKSIALDGRPHNIACGQIDIGNADTEMARSMKAGILQAGGETTAEPTLDLKHVADSVLLMANMPLDANVLRLTVMATKMPFVGRG